MNNNTAQYYRHFKGGIYRLLHIAKNSETQEKVVVYQDRFSPITEAEALAEK